MTPRLVSTRLCCEPELRRRRPGRFQGAPMPDRTPDGTPDQPMPVEPRYQQLFESSPMPLWVYDLETLRILDVNEVACRKYGYTRDEFLSMSILDIRPQE